MTTHQAGGGDEGQGSVEQLLLHVRRQLAVASYLAQQLDESSRVLEACSHTATSTSTTQKLVDQILRLVSRHNTTSVNQWSTARVSDVDIDVVF